MGGKARAFRRAVAAARRIATAGGPADRVLDAADRQLERAPHTLRHILGEVATAVRLVREVLARRYRRLPVRSLVAILAALIYFANPLDAIPDAVLGVGLLDDAAVLGWVLSRLRLDLQAFRDWELSQGPVVDANHFEVAPASPHE
ncbi:MAG TPA: DUF1232 domain-containing protein [Thermoanaerobaculaceae bacterium]|nr:DUF1232 domain-containing protein [Thermoanaerobaculaceae bacterium]HRS17286.1 DUF1232 domain-containing protein [Thermoanaerobaculaceae bacterium]